MEQNNEVVGFTHSITVRVAYADTDRMGYMYYGAYARYLEMGRVEALRGLGLPYAQFEDDGVLMPVLEMNLRYRRPALYDDELTLTTTLHPIEGTRLKCSTDITTEAGLVAQGVVTLVCVDALTRRPTAPPARLVQAILVTQD